MNILYTIFKTIMGVSLLFLLHFFIIFFLPNPFNGINIFFIFFVLFVIGWEKSIVIWIAFFIFYVLELYAITPLGFIILPGMVSVMVIYLLYINVFTNRSWFTSVALSLIAISINRLIYLFLVYTINYSFGISNLVLRIFFINIFWELTLTAFVTGIMFFFLSKKVNRFRRDRVNLVF